MLGRLKALAGTAAVTLCVTSSPSHAYQIDCAILLCMAGGFPPSAECTDAKAEVIRRITPIPVEPPLQLWRCPMGLSPELAAAIGMDAPQLGADGLTPEVRNIRDAIEIYQIYYTKTRHKDDGITIHDSTVEGDYGENGDFYWKRSSFRFGPEWLADAVGGFRDPIYQYYGKDDQYRRIVGYENSYRGGTVVALRLRATAMRFRDWEGNHYTEVVHY